MSSIKIDSLNNPIIVAKHTNIILIIKNKVIY